MDAGTTSGARFWLVAIVVTLLLAVHPIAVFGETIEPVATETTVPDAGQTTDSAAASVTETPADVPAETPAETATAEPGETATVTTTVTPSETQVPVAESATETPSSTATATATATPTVTATETPAGKKNSKTSESQMMAAAANAGPACSLYSSSNTVVPGGYVTYSCVSDTTPFKINITAITADWEWAYSYGTTAAPTGWISTTGEASSASGSLDSVYVYLRPLESVKAGGTASVTLRIERPNGNVLGSFNITAARALQTGNFRTACSPDSITVATSASGTVTCTISGFDIAAGTSVSVSGLTISAPAGWTVTPNVTSGSLTSITSFSVTLTLSPACGAPVNPPAPNVTINATLSSLSAPPFAAPAGAFKAIHGATSTVQVQITGGDLAWSRSYSFAEQSVSGTVSYQIQASGCAGWNVQVSSSPFGYTGSAGGGPIASSNVQVVPGSVTATSGSISNVTPGSTGSLGTPIKVLSASESWGVGTYLQTLGLSVNIPAGSRVGTYTATITLTAASGP